MSTHKQPMGLRIAVAVIGVVMVALAYYAHATKADPVAVQLLVVYGLILIAGIAFEKWRYRPTINRNDPSWKGTDEIFLDPVTGENVRVWFNSRTGERDYRSETNVK